MIIERKTNETHIIVELMENKCLSRSQNDQKEETSCQREDQNIQTETQNYQIATGQPMVDHLLHVFFYNWQQPVRLQVVADWKIDSHHALEDLGYVLGRCLSTMKTRRYASNHTLMDDACIFTAIDLCNRAYFYWQGFEISHFIYGSQLAKGEIQLDDIGEFLKALSREGAMAIHVMRVNGTSPHHAIEALFKSLGRAFNQLTYSCDDYCQAIDKCANIRSTKGNVIWSLIHN